MTASPATAPTTTGSEIGNAGPPGGRRERTGQTMRIVGRLTLVNGAVTLAGLITGPLQARALGVSGRGELAAITVPPMIMTWLLGLGLGGYVSMRAAREEEIGPMVGSILGLQILVSLILIVVSVPFAALLARGRHTVELFLIISFVVTPVGLTQIIAFSIANGRSQWRRMILMRVTPPVVAVACFVALFVVGRLTVASAAIVTIAGGLLATLPLIPTIRECGRLSFHWDIAIAGLRFGLKAWLTSITGLANLRLDQFLMVALVSSAQLGLYSIAVTIAGFAAVLTTSLANAILPRIAKGEVALGARTLRMTLPVLLLAGVAVGIVAPIALPLIYGSAFIKSVPMIWLLIVGSFPLGGATILDQVLTSAGYPGRPAIAQTCAFVITVPGLIVLLPLWGGVGAAIVSIVAYTVNFSLLLMFSLRRFGGKLSDYLVPRPQELGALANGAVAIVLRRGK
jgi:O-antigen/teichoic acid export membrane protein